MVLALKKDMQNLDKYCFTCFVIRTNIKHCYKTYNSLKILCIEFFVVDTHINYHGNKIYWQLKLYGIRNTYRCRFHSESTNVSIIPVLELKSQLKGLATGHLLDKQSTLSSVPILKGRVLFDLW